MTPLIVAEIGANHLGSLARARALVLAAAEAGAWGVKFQTYTPEQMVDPDVVLDKGPWAGRRALELYQEAHTPREWHAELFRFARTLGLEPFSSVFHPDDVDFLEREVPCAHYKIASFELTDLALIRHASATRKMLIISTGMATEPEILEAARAARGCGGLTLLKCTSAYPAEPRDANLMAMKRLRHFPGCVAYGLSDHTKGIGVAVAAAALGATLIEKHLTLRRSDGGPDAEFSMEPEDFTQLVTECTRAAAAIGGPEFIPRESEAPSMALRRAPGGRRGVIG